MGLASGRKERLHLPFVDGVVEQQQHLLLHQVLEHLDRLLLQGALQPRHLPALTAEAGEFRRQVQAAIDPLAAGDGQRGFWCALSHLAGPVAGPPEWVEPVVGCGV